MLEFFLGIALCWIFFKPKKSLIVSRAVHRLLNGYCLAKKHEIEAANRLKLINPKAKWFPHLVFLIEKKQEWVIESTLERAMFDVLYGRVHGGDDASSDSSSDGSSQSSRSTESSQSSHSSQSTESSKSSHSSQSTESSRSTERSRTSHRSESSYHLHEVELCQFDPEVDSTAICSLIAALKDKDRDQLVEFIAKRAYLDKLQVWLRGFCTQIVRGKNINTILATDTLLQSGKVDTTNIVRVCALAGIHMASPENLTWSQFYSRTYTQIPQGWTTPAKIVSIPKLHALLTNHMQAKSAVQITDEDIADSIINGIKGSSGRGAGQ